VLLLPLLGMVERLERRLREKRLDDSFTAVTFTVASAWLIPLMMLTGGPSSPLWIFLLLPVLGVGSQSRTLRGFLGSRVLLGTSLLVVWALSWERTTVRDWLNFVLINSALSVVGIVAWYMVNRERRQRQALAVAQAELRDVNQHFGRASGAVDSVLKGTHIPR